MITRTSTINHINMRLAVLFPDIPERLGLHLHGGRGKTPRHLIVQESEDGFDYTLFDEFYGNLDGGDLYGREGWTILDAALDIITDYENDNLLDISPEDYDEICEKAGL